MKLAASNIGWTPVEDQEALRLFRRWQVTGLEVAPTKVWEMPLEAGVDKIHGYRQWWADRGVEIVATQALLFGRPDLQLFGDAPQREAMAAHVAAMIRLSAQLGARAAVFGSPRNRIVGRMDPGQAHDIAVSFFSRLGVVAADQGVVLCLEPNPPIYGCDFVLTTDEAVALVEAVNHPAFRVQIDTGAMTANGENYARSLSRAVPLAGHCHFSEPNLVEVGNVGTDHHSLAEAWQEIEWDGWVSLEMRAPATGLSSHSLDRALSCIRSNYGWDQRSEVRQA